AQQVVTERTRGLDDGEPPSEQLEAAGVVEPRQGEEGRGYHEDDRRAEVERRPEEGDPAPDARRQEERDDEEGDEDGRAERRDRVEGGREDGPREDRHNDVDEAPDRRGL